MTDLIDAAAADRELKARHRAMWALGDYPAVAREIIPALGPIVVDAVGIGPGNRVLDIAAGAGNAAIPAAERGATVVASDLTPELLETGRQQAARSGASVRFEEADAEQLPYPDASFDAVVSVVGVMFAPHHQAAADELLRVVRPGGRIGLVSWTPEGFIGQMFATMKPYAPPPPVGAQPPPLWGSEAHVAELLGARVTDLRTQRRMLPVTAFPTPAAFRDYFKRTYGPTIAVYRFIAEDAAKVEALDRDLVELAIRFGLTAETGATAWEYLLVTATRT
jgi:ubiquinone/menaquinone biosynthesis C-methylase UbiE